MNIFKEITTFIGWLSGLLAGIAAIFYACGYLITRAYLHLLGVGSLISFSREEYIQEGAKFMVEMADLAGRVSLPLLGTAVIFAAVWFLLRKIGSGRFMAKRGKWFLSQNDGFHWLWRASLFALLLFVLIYLAEKEVGYFAMPLAISDLLFAAKPVANGDAAQVAKWLVSGDRTSLDNLFFNLFLGVVKAGALLYFAWRTAGGWRLRSLLVAPFAVIFLLTLLLLPMTYGVLKKPVRFAGITINQGDLQSAKNNSRLYLVDRTADDFVLWDAAARKVIWLPRAEVKSAMIGPEEFVYKIKNE